MGAHPRAPSPRRWRAGSRGRGPVGHDRSSTSPARRDLWFRHRPWCCCSSRGPRCRHGSRRSMGLGWSREPARLARTDSTTRRARVRRRPRSGRRGPPRRCPGPSPTRLRDLRRRTGRAPPRRPLSRPGRPAGSRRRGRPGTNPEGRTRARRPRTPDAWQRPPSSVATRLAHSPDSSIQYSRPSGPNRGCCTQVVPSVIARVDAARPSSLRSATCTVLPSQNIFGRSHVTQVRRSSSSERLSAATKSVPSKNTRPPSSFVPSSSRATSVLTGAAGSVWSSRIA